MRKRRAHLVLAAFCVLFCLCLAPEAWANPFEGLQTKIKTMVESFVNIIRVILVALLVWSGVDFARGNGQAWVKFAGAIFGFLLVSQHKEIMDFFTGS